MSENPKRAGLLTAYQHIGWQMPPPNPYPLRTEDRRKWSDGWVIGRRLRKKHDEELEATLEKELT
jgi:hypothetical protein